jgi:SAM-dependent methyltransferase
MDKFAIAAQYYRYRTAYSEKFFEKLATDLSITKASTLLDLACGGGEISFGLSQYAGQIIGIDQSDAMLKNASDRDISNISFYQQDLNSSMVKTESKVDCVTIGRAIPYLNLPTLKKTLSYSLKPGRPVIICGAGLGPETAWLDRYQQIRKTVRNKKDHADYRGMRAMQTIDYSYLGTIGDQLSVRYRIDDIINHALSFASQTQAILDNMQSFKTNLEDTLAPFRQQDGTYIASEISWGHVFQYRN